MNTNVAIKSLKMKNPVTTASGTFGQGDNYEDFFDISILGALTTKSVTLKMRPGNPPPRIAETPSGCLNSIGLQNPGVEQFILKYKDFFSSLSIPLIVSIAGHSIEEYKAVAAAIVKGLPFTQALEINVSCPNVDKGGLQFACDPKLAALVVQEVRSVTEIPLILKLTPNTDKNIEVAAACIEAGADALAVMNTLKGMVVDLKKRKPILANVIGGLSGPAVKPVALRMVHEMYQTFPETPIIGMGGIASAQDALEFIMAGATAVSVGTMGFVNPSVYPHIISGITKWLEMEGISSVDEFKGSLIIR